MRIVVETLVHASPERVWEAWTSPADIVAWNFASPDWHCPSAEVDLRPGGLWKARMEAKDGSFGFDLEARLSEVEPPVRLVMALGDGREVETRFEPVGDAVKVSESFDAEEVNPPEAQRAGWQAILDNFRLHVEDRG